MAPRVMGFVMSRKTYDAPTTLSFSDLYMLHRVPYVLVVLQFNCAGGYVRSTRLLVAHDAPTTSRSVTCNHRVLLRCCSGVCNSARSLTRCWNWRKGNDRLHGIPLSFAGVDLFSYVVALDMRRGSR